MVRPPLKSFGYDTVLIRTIASAMHRTATIGDHITVSALMDRILSHWVSCPSSSSPQEVFEVPRYFFHVKRGQMTVLDQEGIELADAAQAELEAARRAQQSVTGDALNGLPVSRGTIIVDDENWRRLFELPF
jgi:hypothetical protein